MHALLLLSCLSAPALADIAPPGPSSRGEIAEDLPPPSDPGARPAWVVPAGVAVTGGLMLAVLVVVRVRG